MALESLIRLIGTLGKQIERHDVLLRQSEALVRYALIDPLLRELGWDTANPDLVRPEYRLGRMSADYALLDHGKPAMVVEAKRLGADRQAAASQGIRYCIEDGIRHFAITDGRKWEIYETHRPVPIDEKKIITFDLAESPDDACLQALALWRRGIRGGTVREVPKPIVGPGPRPVVVPLPPDWIPLPESWKALPQSGGSPPSELQLPDGTLRDSPYFGRTMVEIVGWLYTNGHLNESHCPVSSSARGHVMATTPVHPTGNPFQNPRTIGPLHLELNRTGKDILRRTCAIIEAAGMDPARFRVRFEHRNPEPSVISSASSAPLPSDDREGG